MTRYYDTFAGLVPVRVLALHRAPDFGYLTADVRILRTRGAYKAGEVLTGIHAHSIVERAPNRGPYLMCRSVDFSKGI